MIRLFLFFLSISFALSAPSFARSLADQAAAQAISSNAPKLYKPRTSQLTEKQKQRLPAAARKRADRAERLASKSDVTKPPPPSSPTMKRTGAETSPALPLPNQENSVNFGGIGNVGGIGAVGSPTAQTR